MKTNHQGSDIQNTNQICYPISVKYSKTTEYLFNENGKLLQSRFYHDQYTLLISNFYFATIHQLSTAFFPFAVTQEPLSV